jgi:ribosomal protein S18 acetylase RimI-like enzyme
MTFFAAKDENGVLLGYVEVANKMDMTLLEDMTWHDDESRELAEGILSSEYVYIKQLAVKKGFQRQGIASYIYRKMEEHVGCPVVVFAANKPKRNEPSIRFHEKNGYTRVSRLYRTNFGEFAEYESFFYVKKN